MWILVIVALNAGSSIATIEFADARACEIAAEKVNYIANRDRRALMAFCVTRKPQ